MSPQTHPRGDGGATREDADSGLLLTGLDLPGMTGIELLAALREVAPALPVAVTSAHALDGTLTSLLGHADEYLEKPVRWTRSSRPRPR